MANGLLAVVGAGGHGRVVADTAEAAGWTVALFDDSTPPPPGPWPVAGNIDALLARLADFAGVIVGIGDNAARLAVQGRLEAAGARFATIVHPAASVSGRASLGAGTVVMAGAVLNTGASAGRGTIVNTGASIDHDCALGAGVHISPGAALAGGVRVGERAWVGIGAAVRQSIRIGADAVVGAGAVVVRDVPDGVTVAGNPARALERGG